MIRTEIIHNLADGDPQSLEGWRVSHVVRETREMS